MKTRILSVMVLFAMAVATVMAQTEKKEEFKVAGNCGMCKTRIEKAAMSVNGVSSAAWDKETKMMAVVFDSGKTDVHKVHMAIANVGHDTEMHRAKDEDYDKLPGCCKYERMNSETTMQQHVDQ